MNALTPVALSLLIASSMPPLLAGEIVTEEVAYRAGQARAKGFLAVPKEPGPHPGIVVFHEWWGLNDFIRERTEALARLGYAVLAADLYGGGQKAFDPQTAAQLSVQVRNNGPELEARYQAAMNYLQRRAESDPEKLAALGFGFGANIALQMARNGVVGLDGVVAFHPPLKLRSPNPPIDEVTAKILVLHAGEDPFIHLIDPDAVDEFQKTMKSVKADLKFVVYPEAMRSFYNPDASKTGEKFNIPMVYHPASASAAWSEAEAFLKQLWEEPADQTNPAR